VERSNTAHWQLVANPCTAPDSPTFVLPMNKQPITRTFFFNCNTHAQNNKHNFLLTHSSQNSFCCLMGLDTFHTLTFQQVHQPTETKTVCYSIQVLFFIYIKSPQKCIQGHIFPVNEGNSLHINV
jgi:hypothetical protein